MRNETITPEETQRGNTNFYDEFRMADIKVGYEDLVEHPTKALELALKLSKWRTHFNEEAIRQLTPSVEPINPNTGDYRTRDKETALRESAYLHAKKSILRTALLEARVSQEKGEREKADSLFRSAALGYEELGDKLNDGYLFLECYRALQQSPVKEEEVATRLGKKVYDYFRDDLFDERIPPFIAFPRAQMLLDLGRIDELKDRFHFLISRTNLEGIKKFLELSKQIHDSRTYKHYANEFINILVNEDYALLAYDLSVEHGADEQKQKEILEDAARVAEKHHMYDTAWVAYLKLGNKNKCKSVRRKQVRARKFLSKINSEFDKIRGPYKKEEQNQWLDETLPELERKGWIESARDLCHDLYYNSRAQNEAERLREKAEHEIFIKSLLEIHDNYQPYLKGNISYLYEFLMQNSRYRKRELRTAREAEKAFDRDLERPTHTMAFGIGLMLDRVARHYDSLGMPQEAMRAYAKDIQAKLIENVGYHKRMKEVANFLTENIPDDSNRISNKEMLRLEKRFGDRFSTLPFDSIGGDSWNLLGYGKGIKKTHKQFRKELNREVLSLQARRITGDIPDNDNVEGVLYSCEEFYQYYLKTKEKFKNAAAIHNNQKDCQTWQTGNNLHTQSS